jgi:hypothetical protein
VKHAGPQALDALDPLLREIRRLEIEGLIEKKRGTFYYRGNAMLHFHEDPLGFFADLKVDGEFIRLALNTKREEAEFLRRAAAAFRAVVSRRPKSDA